MGGSHETPFKMKGSGFYGLGNQSPAKAKSSPAKRPEVYVDGVSVGTGSEAVSKGIAAEQANIKVPVTEGVKGTENLKEVTYSGKDAITRLKQNVPGSEEHSKQATEYKKTGVVSGKGSDRAKAAKSLTTT